MRIQNSSAGFRYGDTNPEHVLAVKRVIEFWNNNRKFNIWEIREGGKEVFDEKFIQENYPTRRYSERIFFGHEPDLTVYTQKFYKSKGCWFGYLKLIIEVDGESHDKPARQISDGIFKKWVEEHYKGRVKLIRLQKRELVGDKELSDIYLKQKLGDYIV